MAKRWERRKGARGHPYAQIDKEYFENLCAIQCTKEEIKGFFSVSDRTLSGWCRRTYGKVFSEVFAEKSVPGKISLRRTQFQLAKTSAAMAIFLGKNYLGQHDERIQKVNDSENEGIQIIDDLKGDDDETN